MTTSEDLFLYILINIELCGKDIGHRPKIMDKIREVVNQHRADINLENGDNYNVYKLTKSPCCL
jgi:hypothetical protein